MHILKYKFISGCKRLSKSNNLSFINYFILWKIIEFLLIVFNKNLKMQYLSIDRKYRMR